MFLVAREYSLFDHHTKQQVPTWVQPDRPIGTLLDSTMDSQMDGFRVHLGLIAKYSTRPFKKHVYYSKYVRYSRYSCFLVDTTLLISIKRLKLVINVQAMHKLVLPSRGRSGSSLKTHPIAAYHCLSYRMLTWGNQLNFKLPKQIHQVSMNSSWSKNHGTNICQFFCFSGSTLSCISTVYS